MAKKDISRTVTAGKPKQKLLLIGEHIARKKLGQKGLLSDKEENSLRESFKTGYEIHLWKKYDRADQATTTGIINLQGLLYEVKMHYSNLRGYILVWNTIENAELLVNSVLHEIKDPKERKEIAGRGAKGIDVLFSQTVADPEGYIEVKVGGKKRPKSFTLLEVMENVKQEALIAITRWMSWEKALLDFMDREGFRIKTYRKEIKRMREQIEAGVIGWEKYEGKLKSGMPHPRLSKILEQYNVCPDLSEVEIDQEEYNGFTEDFLYYE